MEETEKVWAAYLYTEGQRIMKQHGIHISDYNSDKMGMEKGNKGK